MLRPPTSRWPLALLLAAFALTMAGAQNAPAQQSGPQQNAADTNQAHGRLVLVLPFTNHSTKPNLDWIGESFPEVLNTRLTAVGFLPISRADRLYALDHLGLPADFQPTHASTLRIAQMLDADYVVVGSYESDGNHLKTSARVLDVSALSLGAPIESPAQAQATAQSATGQTDLAHLLNVDNSMAWHVAKALDPNFAVAEQTFVAADAGLDIAVFENYIRGLVEAAPEERVKHLKEAVRLDPDYPIAWYALGREYFADQQFELAASALGHLPKDDPNALAADFYRGLAYFNSGNYLSAEDAFAFVTTRQPLPEVVNNQGVAASRRGKDATPLFEQAVAADPKDPDYHFNLAVSLRTRSDVTGALREIEQTLKLKPEDTEVQAFDAALKTPPPHPGPASKTTSSVPEWANVAFVPGSGPDAPLQRIKRTYNEASFKQAAFALDQMESMRLAKLTAPKRADALYANGMQFLSRGLMLEAERQFVAAAAADPSNADARAGLAQVREHTGDPDAARAEATKSLQLRQNVPAHLLLARLDIQSNQLVVAAGEVRQALALEPANSAAKGLRQALEARGQQIQ